MIYMLANNNKGLFVITIWHFSYNLNPNWMDYGGTHDKTDLCWTMTPANSGHIKVTIGYMTFIPHHLWKVRLSFHSSHHYIHGLIQIKKLNRLTQPDFDPLLNSPLPYILYQWLNSDGIRILKMYRGGQSSKWLK